MLGIIGAMEEEVAALIGKMEEKSSKTIAAMEFHKGVLEKKEVIVVRSGIGKVNAALCSQILVDCYKVDAIVNTGIAGSLNNEINIGDIVLSSDALQHDVDVTCFGYAPGQIARVDTVSFPADEKLLQLAKECCETVNPDIQVHVGRVVSGDQFISDKEKKKWLTTQFDGFCTEMEGAAIAQAAYLNKIPYLVIRAISDKADDSATVDYPVFEAEAIRHTVKLVLQLLSRLK